MITKWSFGEHVYQQKWLEMKDLKVRAKLSTGSMTVVSLKGLWWVRGRAHMCIGWLIGNNTGSQTITYCQNSPRWAHIHTSIQADNGRLSIYKKRCHIWDGASEKLPISLHSFQSFITTQLHCFGDLMHKNTAIIQLVIAILGQFLPPFENIVSLCFLPFD